MSANKSSDNLAGATTSPSSRRRQPEGDQQQQQQQSTSSLSPPPRKRLRTSTALQQQDMLQEQEAAANNNGEANHTNSSVNMKMKNRGRRGHNKKNADARNAAAAEAAEQAAATQDRNEHTSDESGEDGEALSVTERLIRRVPRRSGLGSVDQEVIRLIGQHLNNIGLKTSAEVLMAEAGCKQDQPTAALFRKHVMNGDWASAVKILGDLKDFLKKPDHLLEMKFLLLEQKYLELLAQKNRIDALKVLQLELSPLSFNQSRTHRLSSFLMLSAADEIAAVTRPALGGETARIELMERLQEFLPANIMLPPKRLNTLLEQAADHQTRNCLFHNKICTDLDTTYLSVDHACSKRDFPCETIQILTAHCEEAMFCKWSPNGLRLASGSKDNIVIIWNFDPETLHLTVHKELDRHHHGGAYFSWSPDSTKLAVCGPEESEENACIWDVESGSITVKLQGNSEEACTYTAFSPDGSRVVCGGIRGQFYTCDEKGELKDTWEGIRVQGLHFRADGKHILAADTHHRIRSYNFEDLTDKSILTEEQAIMSFTVDKTDRYALLNIANQGLHLWDLDSRSLIRKFPGITQGFYTVYSTFGGVNEAFVASGSEDNKIYIYNREHTEPIQILNGHGRTVNCVHWNPVFPRVIVSASDDTTLRLWGPAKQFLPETNGHTNGFSLTNGNGAVSPNGAASSSVLQTPATRD